MQTHPVHQIEARPLFSLLNVTKLASGAFQFSFTNTLDIGFIVFGTTNLSLPVSNWTVLSSPVEVSPGQYRFTDSQATNNPQFFYRVCSP